MIVCWRRSALVWQQQSYKHSRNNNNPKEQVDDFEMFGRTRDTHHVTGKLDVDWELKRH